MKGAAWKRDEQRVVKRDPTEMRRNKSAPECDAIRQLGFNSKFAEHPRGIIVALLTLDTVFCFEHFKNMRLAAVVIGVTP